MYYKHFGLRENPFADNKDPRFLFRTRTHEEALLKLRYGIEDHRAIVALYGAPGTGKSMLLHSLCAELTPPDFHIAQILAYPGVSPLTLGKMILHELGEQRLERYTGTRLDQLQQLVIDMWLKGQRVVVAIDEIHFMPSNTIHVLKTLSNLETPTEKLITCILSGEDKFQRRLNLPTYASLQQRISLMAILKPLNIEETAAYVLHRLKIAGNQETLFTNQALEVTYLYSKGIPRNINKLCDNSLIRAFLDRDHIVNEGHVKIAAEEVPL